MLFSLKLQRNTRVLTGLAVLYLLFGTSLASASHRQNTKHISYRTQLKQDLDGDHLPETVTIRQCGYLYQVSIHFTSGRPKLRLTTYLTEGVADLTLQTTDVDNDSKGDIVIISATSTRPVAVWLNQGKAKFKKVSSWMYGGLGRYRGPALHHRVADGPEPLGTSPNPLPQATPIAELLAAETDSAGVIPSQPESLAFDSILWQDPPRGPPATSRV